MDTVAKCTDIIHFWDRISLVFYLMCDMMLRCIQIYYIPLHSAMTEYNFHHHHQLFSRPVFFSNFLFVFSLVILNFPKNILFFRILFICMQALIRFLFQYVFYLLLVYFNSLVWLIPFVVAAEKLEVLF